MKRNKRETRYRVTITATAASIVSMRKKLKTLSESPDDVETQILKIERGPSRSDRLSEIASDIESAKSDIETLREELQEWHDNLPENLQGGSKASDLEDAISALETIEQNLDDAVSECSSVSFPSMMG